MTLPDDANNTWLSGYSQWVLTVVWLGLRFQQGV